MKLYVVSDASRLLSNTGFITSSHMTYDAAFQAAEVGQYIHNVDVQDVVEIVNAGKMAVRVDGGTK